MNTQVYDKRFRGYPSQADGVRMDDDGRYCAIMIFDRGELRLGVFDGNADISPTDHIQVRYAPDPRIPIDRGDVVDVRLIEKVEDHPGVAGMSVYRYEEFAL